MRAVPWRGSSTSAPCGAMPCCHSGCHGTLARGPWGPREVPARLDRELALPLGRRRVFASHPAKSRDSLALDIRLVKGRKSAVPGSQRAFFAATEGPEGEQLESPREPCWMAP